MDLSEKEIETLVYMGENGEVTGYQIHSKLKLMTNAHWETVRKSLFKKDLIAEIPKKERSKPFWLTGQGIKQSLLNGANPDRLLNHAKVYYTDKRSLNATKGLVELARKDPQNIAIFDIVQKNNKINLNLERIIEATSILLNTEFVKDEHDSEEIEGFKDIMRRVKESLKDQ